MIYDVGYVPKELFPFHLTSLHLSLLSLKSSQRAFTAFQLIPHPSSLALHILPLFRAGQKDPARFWELLAEMLLYSALFG